MRNMQSVLLIFAKKMQSIVIIFVGFFAESEEKTKTDFTY